MGFNVEPLLPPEVRRIRKKLGFESERSGRDLWPGIRAFSRYARGETRQGKALDKLLFLLDRHPDLLDEIRSPEKWTAYFFRLTRKVVPFSDFCLLLSFKEAYVLTSYIAEIMLPINNITTR